MSPPQHQPPPDLPDLGLLGLRFRVNGQAAAPGCPRQRGLRHQIPGFRVTGQAHAAAQALGVLEQGTIDLVLLDHCLPDESGLALVRRLREHGLHSDVQHEGERIFGVFGGSAPDAATLPKGHSTFTVERVREALRTAPGPLPAIEVAAQAGLSRQTAQRYLRLLERTGRVRMSLRYGERGRPEHLYTGIAWIVGAGRGWGWAGLGL